MKDFERAKFANDPAWPERKRSSSFKILHNEIAERGKNETTFNFRRWHDF